MAGSWVIWTSLETWTRRSATELLSCTMELPYVQAGRVSSLTRMPKPNRLNANIRRRPCFRAIAVAQTLGKSPRERSAVAGSGVDDEDTTTASITSGGASTSPHW